MSDDPRDAEGGLAAKHQEFIKSFFKRGAEFAEELLHENERLRFRLLELEARVRDAERGGKPPSDALRELLSRVETLEKEREGLLRQYSEVSDQNSDWKARYLDVERENSNLANLYVASYQLHSTLDLKEVIQIILEILLNFVGARTFALYLLDDADGMLQPIAAEGVDKTKLPSARLGEGIIGKVAQSGIAYLLGAMRPEKIDLGSPSVATPLRIKDETVGAIAIWDFLKQKTALVDVDYELFNLLAAHAAGALQSAKRNAEAGGRPLRLSELREWL
jgi:hypothetical protein